MSIKPQGTIRRLPQFTSSFVRFQNGAIGTSTHFSLFCTEAPVAAPRIEAAGTNSRANVTTFLVSKFGYAIGGTGFLIADSNLTLFRSAPPTRRHR